MSLYIFKLRNSVEGEYILPQDPEGWEKPSLKLKRSARYHGLFHEYSFPLDFTRQSGKAYINNIYETQGIKAEIEIDILYNCNGTGNYRELFLGSLNLTKLNRKRDTLSVPIESRDLSQKILNRDDVPVNLKSLVGLDGQALNAYTYANYNLNLHSRELTFQSQFKESGTSYNNVHTMPASATQITIQNPFALFKNELKTSVNNQNTFFVGGGGPFTGAGSGYFHKGNDPLISYPQTYTAVWNIAGTWRDQTNTGAERTVTGPVLVLGIKAPGATVLTSSVALVTLTGYVTSSDPYNQAFSGSGSTTFNVPEGHEFFLYWFVTSYTVTIGGPENVSFTQLFSTLDISLIANTTTAASTTKAFAIYEAWARLLESITGVNNVLGSIFFGRKNSEPSNFSQNGCGSFTAIADAMDVRGFADRTAAVTVADMFDSCNAIFNIGMGVAKREGQNIIKVEDKAFFYDKSKVMLQLDFVEDLEMNLDLEKFYNLIEIGYKKWEPENLNGLNEYCSNHKYTNEISKNKSTLTLKSPFVASGMAMEVTRRKGVEATTDTKYDNDTFIFALNRTVDGGDNPINLVACEQDENFTTITNVDNSATVYNLRFSPKRNLLRHLNVIGGALEKDAGAEFKFQKGEGNFLLETDMVLDGCADDYSSVLLDEDANLAWDDSNALLSTPLWIPEIYNFNYKLSSSEYTSIRDFTGGPTGVIRISEDGQTYKDGYLLDLDFDINGGLAKFTLLRAY